MSADSQYDWKQFHAYRVFDEFLESFILNQKSYVTRHSQTLDLDAAFDDIHSRFVDEYDESDATYEDKIALQFEGASENTKIVFANVEYLWAMPVEKISPDTKKGYARRWFDQKSQLVEGGSYFFSHKHTIANPGSWYLTNKYWEMVALLRLLSLTASDKEVVDISSAKKQIEQLCYSAIYNDAAKKGSFSVPYICSVHSAFLHLSSPDKYQSIISESHKQQISTVFGHVIADRPDIECREQKIQLIRERLYEDYGDEGHPDYKYRWFFYLDRLKPIWIGKSTASQKIASIEDELQHELAALDLSEMEGEKAESTSYRIIRSAKLVKEAKKRDCFTCRACLFSFRKQIVHVHHLDPLSERKSPGKTSIKDLVTLCPNCHYLAHYWLRKKDKYKNLDELIHKLQKTIKK